MKLVIALVGVASMVAGAVYVRSHDGASVDVERSSSNRTLVAGESRLSHPVPGTAMERLERSIKMKEGTERSLGRFELGAGRALRLYAADTTDGRSCLIEEDARSGPGAGCLQGGLFAARKVAFSVNTDGGPDHFDELYVDGVVAPSIRGVTIVKTDGTAESVDLNAQLAFLYVSPASDLEARVYPTALRLYGPSGTLVETVTFPPAG